MAKKYLYGNLNQDTVRPNYGGSTTDSLIINVDNDKMIISGEVKWDAALGEVAHRAYPGDKGSRNYAKILELSAQLEEEISRAAKSRSSVESKVGELEKTVKILDTSLTTAIRTEAALASEADSIIIEQCRVESERALKAEADLIAALKQEVLSRESVDADLIRRLDDLSGLSVESLEQVRALVVNETSRAQVAEQHLTDKIDGEIARAIKSEQTIVEDINNIEEKLQSSYTKLDVSLAEETTSRRQADNVISDQLETESNRAQKVEESLILEITDLQTSCQELKVAIEKVASKVAEDDSAKLNAELESVSSELEAVKKDLSISVETIETDISRLEQLQTSNQDATNKKIEDILHSVSLNTDLISKLSGKLKDINKHLSTLDVSVRDVQAAVSAEATQRHQADSNIEKSVIRIDTKLDTTRTELLANIDEIDVKTTKLTSSIQSLVSDINEIKQHVEELYEADVVTKDEFNSLSNELKTVYNNIDELSSMIEAEVARAKAAEEANTEAINSLLSTDATYLVQLDQLTTQVESLKLDVYNIYQSIRSNNEHDAAIEGRIADLQSDVSNLHEELTAVSNNYIQTVDNIIEDVSKLSATVEVIQPQLDALKTTVDLIHVELGELTINYDKVVEELNHVDQDVQITQDRISGVQDQLDITTARIDAEIAEHETALIKHDVSTHQHDVDIADLQIAVNELNNADLELSEKIKVVDDQRNVDAEIHNAHYQELVSRLEQEIKRSIAADASLLVDTDRNSGRITSLQIDLTNVISKYVQELMQADAELDEKISYEHTLTEEYKEKVLDEVEDVAAESLQRDEALQAQIESLTGKKDSVPLIENEGTMPEVYSQQGNKTFTVPLEKAVVPEAVVRRDSVGNVLLATDTDVFTTHSAVSKLFVDNVVSELRKEISSISFDFIDGGNAPIG